MDVEMALNDFLIIIVFFASLGNGFVIVSMLMNPKTRTAFGALIINVAFVDFLIGAFLKSSFVVEDYFEGDQIGNMHCYLMTSFITAAPTLEVTTLIVLSLFALFGSVRRIFIDKLLTFEMAFIALFLIWMLCGGMSLINHKVMGKFSSSCAVDDQLLTVTVYAIFISMGLLICTHLLIIAIEQVRKINNTITDMRRTDGVYNDLSEELQSEEIEAKSMERSSRRLVFMLSLFFVLFWMPFYAVRAHYEFNKEGHSLDMVVFQLFAYVFGYFNSIATPVVILAVFPESRHLLRKIDWGRFTFWKNFNPVKKCFG